MEMNLQCHRAVEQTTHNHTFHTSQATGPSLLISGKDKDERPLAESKHAHFGSRKTQSHASHTDISVSN